MKNIIKKEEININRIVLIGRLTKDPETRTTMSGDTFTKFSVAVKRSYQDQNGEKGADYINCVAWRKQAENIAKYCFKGTQVAIEGRIRTGSYEDQDGNRRYTFDVVCDNCTFLSKKASADQSSTMETNNKYEDSVSSIYTDEIELNPDDLPF